MSVLPTSEPAGIREQIRRFFSTDEVPYGLALIRILLPLILFVVMLDRWPHARELYSADGAPAQLAYSYGWGNLLPELPGSVAVALLSLLLFFLLTSAIGWCTRFSLIASTVLYTYFNLMDCVGTITKYSVIAAHVLLLLSVSNCGALWSADSWLGRKARRAVWPGEPTVIRPRFAVWPRRLVQLLVGTVYFGAAITKMHTPEFFSGDQLLFWMITHVNYEHPLGEWLTLYPALLVTFAYISIVWEVLFLFLCWRGWARRVMLTLGVTFHFMTMLTLGLYIFPMIFWTLYFAFLEENDVRWLASRWRRLARRWGRRRGRVLIGTSRPQRAKRPVALPVPSAAVFGFLAVLLAVIGVELEYRLDPYGLRRPEGPYTLEEIDPELARTMLGPEQPIRPEDKFFAFEVGSLLIGESLVNRRSDFRHGDTVIAQCSLNPPHEDMWVECNLHDADNRMIDRVGVIVRREMFRCNYFYNLSQALDPGDYFLVLKAAGTEIDRRKITLRSGPDAPVAN